MSSQGVVIPFISGLVYLYHLCFEHHHIVVDYCEFWVCQILVCTLIVLHFALFMTQPVHGCFHHFHDNHFELVCMIQTDWGLYGTRKGLISTVAAGVAGC